MATTSSTLWNAVVLRIGKGAQDMLDTGVIVLFGEPGKLRRSLDVVYQGLPYTMLNAPLLPASLGVGPLRSWHLKRLTVMVPCREGHRVHTQGGPP